MCNPRDAACAFDFDSQGELDGGEEVLPIDNLSVEEAWADELDISILSMIDDVDDYIY